MLNVTAVDGVLPVQEAEASQTLLELTKTPERCFTHIRRYSKGVILASVFGQRGATYEDPKVQALYHAQEQFTQILAPGATPPVDAFPFLRYMPSFLAHYKSKASAIRKEQRTLYSSLLQDTSTRSRKQDKVPCFMGKLLEKKDKSGLTDDQIVYTGGILMEAGSDTTSSTLHSFVLAMITHPAVLKEAQEELDEVCGATRSPGSQHIKDLPYMNAIMTEILRWRPVAPGGIPHMLTQDDHYNGYFLPKGTILFANTWSIHQDVAEYDEPESFVPERFLDNKFGTLKSSIDEIDDENHRRVTYDFGAGRRVCPGQRLAENSLMINMAKIAWAFDITADPNAPALDLNIETGHSDGFVFGPNPFSASFSVRSPQHLETIEKEYHEAQIFFQQYED
ncbi:hypothetical protein LTR72_009485 [Exophiala xenobiotica]|nr:hypothetical protein LTR72_009485 [Exophiala xenobiotica]KAK5291900.1 hypothetical protein LTR14_005449 [Exophiala xenobiotica]KAK5314250.1 hypothetical protein LTR93_010529 [Exophiala xenobiotica]KAK5401920.1 hypothetical protein LTR06_010838 [Exophiala xenobiotica]KAK5494687.1 hypothetical protein LTR55_003074 [Exophiala xenobiotica]